MNEIDLSKYAIRTDLITEILEDKVDIKGIKREYKKVKDIEIERVTIEKEAIELINKKEGIYVTISFKDVTDSTNKEKVEKVLTEEIKILLKNKDIKDDMRALIIGLGNDASTPDALGPKVIDNILVTRHLFDIDEINVSSDYRPVSVLTPGVYATTGMETQSIINGIVKETRPDFLIVVDALAASSIDRVNKTIQLTDAGISPGSGVGNTRKELSKETLGIPVIAIGVPTVVDAVTIVSDTIHYLMKKMSYNITNIDNATNKLKIANRINYLEDNNMMLDSEERTNLLGIIGSLSDDEMRELIHEVLSPIGYNMMVTPKEIDFVIEKLSMLIGKSINQALHKSVK